MSYTLVYPQPVGRQEYTYVHRGGDSFKDEIAPARTFGFVKDMKAMAAMGLASGGRLDNCILIDDEGIVNTQLRFPDEFARHKILDIMGDFYLLGRPLRGRIVARKTGHSDNIALLQKVRDAMRALAFGICADAVRLPPLWGARTGVVRSRPRPAHPKAAASRRTPKEGLTADPVTMASRSKLGNCRCSSARRRASTSSGICVARRMPKRAIQPQHQAAAGRAQLRGAIADVADLVAEDLVVEQPDAVPRRRARRRTGRRRGRAAARNSTQPAISANPTAGSTHCGGASTNALDQRAGERRRRHGVHRQIEQRHHVGEDARVVELLQVQMHAHRVFVRGRHASVHLRQSDAEALRLVRLRRGEQPQHARIETRLEAAARRLRR